MRKYANGETAAGNKLAEPLVVESSGWLFVPHGEQTIRNKDTYICV